MSIGRHAKIFSEFNAQIVDTIHAAANKVSMSNDRLACTLSENSKREVAARDRVDISLAEYMQKQEQIKELSDENRYLKAICGKIGLPYEVPIIPDSIRKIVCADLVPAHDFTQKFLIEFSCDMVCLTPEQKKYMMQEFVYD